MDMMTEMYSGEFLDAMEPERMYPKWDVEGR